MGIHTELDKAVELTIRNTLLSLVQETTETKLREVARDEQVRGLILEIVQRNLEKVVRDLRNDKPRPKGKKRSGA